MLIVCRMADSLEGPNPPPCASAFKKTPVHPSVKLKNYWYLITCGFKFFNTILAKFNGGLSVMSLMSHGSSVQWVIWVMG
jgi:hypothetical protein